MLSSFYAGKPVYTKKAAAANPAGKAHALQVIVSCRALDIGQAAGGLLALPVLEPFPTGQQPFKLF